MTQVLPTMWRALGGVVGVGALIGLAYALQVFADSIGVGF
jgi:hypothetical protein